MREQIARVFEGKAFLRPLFYGYPGGLRVELAEPGSSTHQFRTALNKSVEICKHVFGPAPELVVCLRTWVEGSAFAARQSLRKLRALGIHIPKQREIWISTSDDGYEDEDDWTPPDPPADWVTIAFPIDITMLEPLLWSACATDFNIEPKAPCSVHLMDLARGVMALPYDDRGMDIVGPNHALLSEIFTTYRHYLLGYDMEIMQATFAPEEVAPE
ncbi:DUF3885 domain-containing protein [Pigmentiphaga aceris]|uniref:DUF3885 domain-containing protein n=1 Tax=Pigmentiphaga aceris TaxID=1940612 RepID=A0A5C0B7H0_9BURK|nr:DUF3885 domain-containing protein [Pigmentiphaga aceris]QEI08687.1 DUF3885 domain-containing protein [Pigmentiphaga aceris]